MNVAGRSVLVTGANRGIGQALVEEALRRGAIRVYAGTRRTVRHPDRRVRPVALDVTDAAQIRAAVQQVESLDILINRKTSSLIPYLRPSHGTGIAAPPRRSNANTRCWHNLKGRGRE